VSENTSRAELKKRSWRGYLGAFGRAHRKASIQMESSMPLLRHLDELRRRIFIAFFAIVITTVISLLFASQLIEILSTPIGGSDALVSIEVTENIAIFMRVSLLFGIILGMPVVVYQAMRFMLPGLRGREKLWLLIGVPAASLLFITGVAFAWFIMLPAAIPFLVNFLDITTQVRPANYFDFITRIMFWLGLSFEMPLVFMILAKFQFITARKLISGWRYAFVAIALIAAAVTPTVDPVNMGIVMLPLTGLYVISVILAAIAGRQ
jgi:sec-independent protein translocase protein TatC